MSDRPRVPEDAEARGRRAVETLRADPRAVAGTELGGWFDAGRKRRIARRLLVRLPRSVRPADVAFWAGVRAAATSDEWRRLTRSSYVALYYHRLAGEGKDGQERLDLPPELFARQLRLLRWLGFRPLAPEDLIAFHSGDRHALPRRSFVVTADDAFRDVVEPFLRHAAVRPLVFVPTHEVGGRSWWAGDEPVASWEELERLAQAGVGLGSHTRRHASLPGLEPAALADELEGSRRDLEQRGVFTPLLAYPHGRSDEAARAAAASAGYRAAFTTSPGRNGAGTDPYLLRRIGVKAWDSRLSFLWKVATGELLPARWDARRARRSSRRRRPTPAPRGGEAAGRRASAPPRRRAP
ncbi:MAG TPA: polysaccharide deacetylase family protein [Gaiellaceae bacterium]